MAEALVAAEGDMVDSAEWRQHAVLQGKLYALLADKENVHLYKVLKDIWDGNLDGALKTELVETGEHALDPGEYDLDKLPKVGPLERSSDRKKRERVRKRERESCMFLLWFCSVSLFVRPSFTCLQTFSNEFTYYETGAQDRYGTNQECS